MDDSATIRRSLEMGECRFPVPEMPELNNIDVPWTPEMDDSAAIIGALEGGECRGPTAPGTPELVEYH